MDLHPLVEKTTRALERLKLLASDLVVAISGGSDSVALLLALNQIYRPPQRLVMAHLNHRLRGEESDADEAFVRSLHASLSELPRSTLELQVASRDIQSEATAAGENLEGMARTARYEWLTKVAVEASCRAVVTGHTADDQAESVLHRLMRGSGLLGICGIAEARELEGGILLARPMLQVARAEVLSFLEDQKQEAREDSSNQDLQFTRNRIRHHLLPLLREQYNPAIAEVLCRLAEQAREAHQLEVERGRDLLIRAEKPRAGRVVILSLGELCQSSGNSIRAALRLVWDREKWPTGKMGFEQWKRLEAICFEKSSTDLPGRLRARCRGKVLQVGFIEDLQSL